MLPNDSVCCYSQRKVKNSESKSQLTDLSVFCSKGCYSQRKVKNSESKSQLQVCTSITAGSCYSQRKVKNSESKSQPPSDPEADSVVLLFTA